MLLFIVCMGCGIENSSGHQELTDELKEQIEIEIRQRVDDYFENVKSKILMEYFLSGVIRMILFMLETEGYSVDMKNGLIGL